jgi:hypothetical protein
MTKASLQSRSAVFNPAKISPPRLTQSRRATATCRVVRGPEYGGEAPTLSAAFLSLELAGDSGKDHAAAGPLASSGRAGLAKPGKRP